MRIIYFAKTQAIIFGSIGLILGIIYSFGGLLIDTLVTLGLFSTTETPGLSYGTILAFGALFIMPVIMLAIGFIFGILEGLIINFLCRYSIIKKWLSK
tara:strand:- start:38293 stop:38586 length:294 start_codon:yes stop_codon:yes gene_type:complete